MQAFIHLPFLHGVICSERHADTHAPMHLCIVWVAISLNVSMHSCIHPGVCGCSHTFIHPIPDLRLSSFLACTFNFFWFYQFWLCSRTHTFSIALSLPILLIVLISGQQSWGKEFQPHASLWTPPYLPSTLDAQFLENSVHSCCSPPSLSFSSYLAPLAWSCPTPWQVFCWGIGCQGLSNGLDKGVYLFIPAEALDCSWSHSICVLTGMSAGEGAWLLWKSSYALLVAELFPTPEYRMLVGYTLLHSVIRSLPPSLNVSFHKALTCSYPAL